MQSIPASDWMLSACCDWEEAEEPIARIEEEILVGLVWTGEGHNKTLESSFWIIRLQVMCVVGKLKLWEAIIHKPLQHTELMTLLKQIHNIMVLLVVRFGATLLNIESMEFDASIS